VYQQILEQMNPKVSLHVTVYVAYVIPSNLVSPKSCVTLSLLGTRQLWLSWIPKAYRPIYIYIFSKL